jgi:hypothetical protein
VLAAGAGGFTLPTLHATVDSHDPGAGGFGGFGRSILFGSGLGFEVVEGVEGGEASAAAPGEAAAAAAAPEAAAAAAAAAP